ncbi:MORN motif-containing protein, partial [Microcoleus sp. herbarium5]
MLSSIQKLGMVILVASCIGSATNLLNPQPSMAQPTPEPTPEAKPEEGKRSPFCQGNPPTGRVKCNYEGGDNYEGNFVNGLPDGSGVYVYANGDRYEGQFRKGVPDGRGTFIFKDDARYTGVFQDGTMRSGTVVFPNGERYVGDFAVVRNVQTDAISSQPSG